MFHRNIAAANPRFSFFCHQVLLRVFAAVKLVLIRLWYKRVLKRYRWGMWGWTVGLARQGLLLRYLAVKRRSPGGETMSQKSWGKNSTQFFISVCLVTSWAIYKLELSLYFQTEVNPGYFKSQQDIQEFGNACWKPELSQMSPFLHSEVIFRLNDAGCRPESKMGQNIIGFMPAYERAILASAWPLLSCWGEDWQ